MSLVEKIKMHCRLSKERINLLKRKKAEIRSRARKEIVELIAARSIESARIKTEHLIQEDYYSEALDMINNYIEIVQNRAGLIAAQKNADETLGQIIITLIWASPRLKTDVPELTNLTTIFEKHYGKPFVLSSLTNCLNLANTKVVNCLSIQPPSLILVDQYMKALADEHHLEFTPKYLDKETEFNIIESNLIKASSSSDLTSSTSNLDTKNTSSNSSQSNTISLTFVTDKSQGNDSKTKIIESASFFDSLYLTEEHQKQDLFGSDKSNFCINEPVIDPKHDEIIKKEKELAQSSKGDNFIPSLLMFDEIEKELEINQSEDLDLENRLARLKTDE